jgi:hypothetical protein
LPYNTVGALLVAPIRIKLRSVTKGALLAL